MIKMIYASDKNGVIGKDNKLPWHLPTDLQRFKRKTDGCIVVMGRRTFESLPEAFRPLPGRTNVVVTRSRKKLPEGVLRVSNLDKYLKTIPRETVVWVIGGASIYEQALPYVDEIHHSEIQAEFPGDTYFKSDLYKNDFVAKEQYLCTHPEDFWLSYIHREYHRKK